MSGFISNQGHIPTSKDPLWDYYFTIGPLARYAEDLPLMLRTMIPSRNHPETLRLDEQVWFSVLAAIHFINCVFTNLKDLRLSATLKAFLASSI